MPKPTASPRLPDSPGAWIACFRHRVQCHGRALSPEDFGKLIGRSGATVRRWESNTTVPAEDDIARIASGANLSPQQFAFLSAACTRIRVMPPPNQRAFRAYMGDVLSSTPYPAMVLDGLFYIRGWNSYVDALAPGVSRVFKTELHTMALMLRSGPEALFDPDQRQAALREGVRIFWMSTATHSHRPEYARLVEDLQDEPQFRDLWMDLALCNGRAPKDPITFAHSLGGSGARFRVYSRTISFPPAYYLHEYQPADALACGRLERLAGRGPPRAYFQRRLHWVDSSVECC
jgi:hypothetical protein